MCRNMVDQVVPTRYSSKIVTLRCGSTSIYGDTLLCASCRETQPNPPVHLREDAGEDDLDAAWRFEP
jgi:hypothetical protein